MKGNILKKKKKQVRWQPLPENYKSVDCVCYLSGLYSIY
jgi:hypothetical protein